MALDPPLPGQVIRYAYLWWNDARVGREDGVKDRPCGIVLTRQTDQGNTMVYVLPIMHTPPLSQEDGMEIEVTGIWKSGSRSASRDRVENPSP